MDASELLLFFAGAMAPAAILALGLGYAVRQVAPRMGLVDRPDSDHKTHSKATPLGGGAAIYLSVVLTFALGQAALHLAQRQASLSAEEQTLRLPPFVRAHLAGLARQSGELWVLLACGGVLALVGLADDRYGLSWQPRLVVQLAVASFAVFGRGWRLTAFIESPEISGALSVLWIVTLVNAFNMLDNMDGLSAGVAAIGAISLAGVLLSPALKTGGPQLFTAGFLLVLSGGLVGFLWHNRPRARLFMGDAGSYFVGFSLAVGSMLGSYTSYDAPTRHVILAPLCVMAVPLYDLASVVLIRIARGRSIFRGDRNHFSHRLVDLGMTRPQAVFTIYIVTGATCLGALLLPRVDLVGAVLIVLLELCVLLVVAMLEIAARR